MTNIKCAKFNRDELTCLYTAYIGMSRIAFQTNLPALISMNSKKLLSVSYTISFFFIFRWQVRQNRRPESHMISKYDTDYHAPHRFIESMLVLLETCADSF